MRFDFAQFREDARTRITNRRDLAASCGVTYQRINQWLRGDSNPSLDLTLGLCKALGMDVWRYYK